MTLDTSIPLDTKVPNPMQPISGMLNIASGVQNMQAQRLQMQGQQQANTNAGIALGERQNLRQVMADPTQYTAPDGTIDYNKALPLILKAAPTTGMDVVKNMMATQQQATQARTSIMNMNEGQRTILGKVAGSLQGQPQDVIDGTLNALAKQNPQLASSLPMLQQGLRHWRATGGQPAVDAALNRFSQSVMSPTEQIAANTPDVVPVNNGAQSYGVNVKPGVRGIPEGTVVQGTGATMQPPPTQPTIGGPEGTTPGIIGASPAPAPGQLGAPAPMRANNPGALMPGGKMAQFETPQAGLQALDSNLQSYGKQGVNTLAGVITKWAPPGSNNTAAYIADAAQRLGIKPDQKIDLSNPVVRQAVGTAIMLHENGAAGVFGQQEAPQQQPRSGFIPTALPPGQAANLQNNFDQMNTHFTGLQSAAAQAPLVDSLIGNIKSLAPMAATGTESGKEAYIAGLLNKLTFGKIQATGDLQKDTDLLQKNMAQLNLATPASTDAMRAIVEAGRPHSTMSASAIIDAADQLESQVKTTLAERDYLQKYKMADGGKGDAQGYQSARSQFESNVDPRVFQLEGKSPQEMAQFMAKLTPADRAALVQKARQMHQMGIIQ